MITVAEALQRISAQARDFGTEEVELLKSAGRVLAQDVIADRPYPPFNRVTMDGIAIHSNAFNAGEHSYTIEGVQAAGHAQQTLQNADHCLEVMTGAMLPIGTDVVIQYEHCKISNGRATVDLDEIKIFQNVHSAGTDREQGQVLIAQGRQITATMIGLMAAAGLSRVSVRCLPKIAVCATGDELVEVDQQPLPYQIRQSNSYMLIAALQAEGIAAQRYHLPDDPQKMLEQLTTLTSYYDAVLLSGGVSKGKFDFLPEVLKNLGLTTLFHGIAQRPGKPFLFGKMPNNALIFGLPGNPVSTLVCYQLYFKNWLYTSLGIPPPAARAFLTQPFSFKPSLTLHLLVSLSFNQGKLAATPVETSTSGDLVSLALTEGILSLPAGRQEFGIDEAFDLVIL